MSVGLRALPSYTAENPPVVAKKDVIFPTCLFSHAFNAYFLCVRLLYVSISSVQMPYGIRRNS